jgi:DNA-binding transcriptional MerR regulator
MNSQSVLKPLLKIGALAKQTQVSVGTLRYYESLGLLTPAQRAKTGYRYYAVTAIEQVQFIQKAQTLGFSLPEIQRLLGIRVPGPQRRVALHQLLDQKILALGAEIQRLTRFQHALADYQAQVTIDASPDVYCQGVCELITRSEFDDVG